MIIVYFRQIKLFVFSQATAFSIAPASKGRRLKHSLAQTSFCISKPQALKMQQDSLSVEDLTFGFSDLLNENLEKNTQENPGNKKRQDDLADLFSKGVECDIASTAKPCPHDAKNIDCQSSSLLSTNIISSKRTKKTVPSLSDAKESSEPDESSGTRKGKSHRTDLKLSLQKPKFMSRSSDGKANKNIQYCIGKQELECRSEDINSERICHKQKVLGQDLTDNGKKHLWEDSKRKKGSKTEPATRQLKTVEAAQSELVPKKLLNPDQLMTNPGSSPQKIFSQPRRLSAPFLLRPLSPRCCSYKPIATQDEHLRGDDKIYPARSKLFSPTPPRKNSKDQPKLSPNELKFSSLTCEQTSGQSLNDSKRSSHKSPRQHKMLTALPISLCHKEFEPTRVECRLVQAPNRREAARRQSYELATSSEIINNFGETKTHHDSHLVSPRAARNSNLLVPLLSGRRKSDSSIAHFATFDSPIFDGDIDEKLTPLNLSPQATKKGHPLNLSIG